jgi:hypothetical protein
LEDASYAYQPRCRSGFVVFSFYSNRHRLMVVVLLFTVSSEAEHRRLNFAATLLSGIGLIFLMAMAMYYFDGYTPATQQREANNDVGKSIFNSCIQVLPPATFTSAFDPKRTGAFRSVGGQWPQPIGRAD